MVINYNSGRESDNGFNVAIYCKDKVRHLQNPRLLRWNKKCINQFYTIKFNNYKITAKNINVLTANKFIYPILTF